MMWGECDFQDSRWAVTHFFKEPLIRNLRFQFSRLVKHSFSYKHFRSVSFLKHLEMLKGEK